MSSTTFDLRILLPAHKDAVLAFARAQLETQVADAMEREMQSWSARWRPEALDHYLGLGWSFASFAPSGEVNGFILGQPFIFHRGHTQTLWVEHFAFATPEIAQALLETAYKWARDKHFQCVLIEERPETETLVRQWRQAHPVQTPLIELRSARF